MNSKNIFARGKFLFVDDDEIALLLFEQKLIETGFSQALYCNSAEVALQILRDDPTIHLVVADIDMSKTSKLGGLDLLRLIKKSMPNVEVILHSGFQEFSYAKSALREGAFDYVVKEMNLIELCNSIDRAFKYIATSRTIAAVSGTIFVSYSRDDSTHAQALVAKLRRAGFNPWIDTENIIGGENWQQAIERAIAKSAFFVTCLSSNSVSKRGVIRKELRAALEVQRGLLESDIFVIPLRLEPCDLPEELAAYQSIDYYTVDGWERLLSAIHEGLRRRASDA